MSTFGSQRERVTLKPLDLTIVNKLKAELKVPTGIAAILAGRKLATFEDCKAYFRPELSHFHDPFLFSDMECAVERILTALQKNELITVYGDYDVDGVTSTALMVRVLRTLGAPCEYVLPNRLIDGYGISETGIQLVAQSGSTLIISVDCGVTAFREIDIARSLGMDVIITDHHEPKETLPSAIAVINPKVHGSNYPDKNLAGVGVALKLCQALAVRLGKGNDLWLPYLDLAALGTAADIVPLIGENRIITKFGFDILRDTRHVGLKSLISQQGLTGKKLSTSQVVFQLAPCINAVGRLGDPRRGVDLLLTDDPETGSSHAQVLRETNLERRALDSAVAEEAYSWVNGNCNLEKDYALVLGQEQWHVGVIGIVASKLVERFNRPSILFSIGSDGIAKGSGRSVPSLHLLDALKECGNLLEGFGGHAAAAGMSIKSQNIPEFRERFNETVRSMMTFDDLVPEIKADAEVSLSQLNPKFLRIINEMEPFGPGNMRPVLFCRDLKHKYPPKVVGQNHLKMSLTGEGIIMDAIGFNFGDRHGEISQTDKFGLAFSLDENEYNGRCSLQMRVKGFSL
jgi:single-stranded-DNA-specific exonuclease